MFNNKTKQNCTGKKTMQDFEKMMSTPLIDDADMINKILEKVQRAVAQTEIQSADGYRLKLGEPVKMSVGEIMAIVKSTKHIAFDFHIRHAISEYEHDKAELEVYRRLERFYRDKLYQKPDIKNIGEYLGSNSFSRLYEIFQGINLYALMDTCLDFDCAEIIEREINASFPFSNPDTNTHRVGDVLIAAASTVNNMLFGKYGEIFRQNEDKTVFELDIDESTVKNILSDIGTSGEILRNLLLEPLCDRKEYEYRIDLAYDCIPAH